MGRSVVADATGSLHGYVIAGAGASLVPSQQRMIIAYRLGATGKLPDTVGS